VIGVADRLGGTMRKRAGADRQASAGACAFIEGFHQLGRLGLGGVGHSLAGILVPRFTPRKECLQMAEARALVVTPTRLRPELFHVARVLRPPFQREAGIDRSAGGAPDAGKLLAMFIAVAPVRQESSADLILGLRQQFESPLADSSAVKPFSTDRVLVLENAL